MENFVDLSMRVLEEKRLKIGEELATVESIILNIYAEYRKIKYRARNKTRTVELGVGESWTHEG